MFEVSIKKIDKEEPRKLSINIQGEDGFEDMDVTLNISDEVARYFLLLIGKNMQEIIQHNQTGKLKDKFSD